MRSLVAPFCRISLVLFAAAFAVPSLAAQSDILLRLRSGSPAGDRFRVDSAGGFVALGTLGIGIVPHSNEGERTMWYPFRSAFRSGSIHGGIGGCADCWNDANIGFYSWAGGVNTMARGLASFAFGSDARAEGQYSIAIGDRSVAHAPPGGPFATGGVAMGIQANVRDRAGVALGELVTSNGDAAIAMGFRATARADYAMAVGRSAVAAHLGAFVWGGVSSLAQTDSVLSSTAGEFTVRAPGGIRMRTNFTMTTGCNLVTATVNWTCSSTRDIKENFIPVDHEDILQRVAGVPLNWWTLIDDPSRAQHIGPFAEDFYEAFGLGSDEKAIGHMDLGGINFAGVQALERRTTELRQALAERDRRIEELEARVARLDALVTSLAGVRD